MLIVDCKTHRLAVGSVTDGAVSLLMAGDRADLVYSDPPWGAGNLKYWRTQNGESCRPDWPAFVSAFVAAVDAHCAGWAFVEMGLRWAGEVSTAFAAAGWPERHRHTMTYGRPARPNNLLAYHRGESWPVGDPLPADGWAATAAVARRFAVPDGVMLDPCVGLGRSAALFARRGMRVCGLELSPSRLARAELRLRKC